MTQRAWTSRPGLTEPVVIDDSVRTEWDLDDAVSDAEPGNLFPSRVGWNAASENADLLRAIDGELAAGYRGYPVEHVPVPKLDRTTRPAADMAAEDQILYAALVNSLKSRIPEGLVNLTGEDEQSYSEFEQFPLLQEGVRYVVEGDVAAFYQYINYERLAYELIGLTGWADAVEPLVRLFEHWMAAPQGIPQGPRASFTLADVYISPAARRLSRAGLAFSRYSDDFRIAADNWPAARQAQLELEGALRGLGLVLAAGKSRTWKTETYRERLERVAEPRLAGPASREAFDELETEGYLPGIGEALVVAAQQVRQAEQVLAEQLEPVRADVIGTRLIRRALPILGSGSSAFALQHFRLLLGRYPHLTQTVSVYLRLLMGTPFEVEAVSATLEWMRGHDFRYPWQVGWLIHALCFASPRNEHIGQYATEAMLDPTLPWFARGRAAIAVAVHADLPPLAQFLSTYELTPPAARPDFVAATAISRNRWRTRFLEGAAVTPLLAAVARFEREDFTDWI